MGVPGACRSRRRAEYGVRSLRAAVSGPGYRVAECGAIFEDPGHCGEYNYDRIRDVAWGRLNLQKHQKVIFSESKFSKTLAGWGDKLPSSRSKVTGLHTRQ